MQYYRLEKPSVLLHLAEKLSEALPLKAGHPICLSFPLQLLQVDHKNTFWSLCGTSNILYQLNSSLKITHFVNTGKLDKTFIHAFLSVYIFSTFEVLGRRKVFLLLQFIQGKPIDCKQGTSPVIAWICSPNKVSWSFTIWIYPLISRCQIYL